jgi:DNA-directed RNA polymerase subunit beta'
MRECSVFVQAGEGEKRAYLIPQGSTLLVKEGQTIEAGDVVAEYDPSYEYIIAESNGIAKFFGISPNVRHDDDGNQVAMYAQKDGEVFIYNPDSIKECDVVSSSADKYVPYDRLKVGTEIAPGMILDTAALILDVSDSTEIKDKKAKVKGESYRIKFASGEAYTILSGARLYITDASKVAKGEVLSRERIGDSDAKTKDIVQGLPRVEELFEARKPKESAILSNLSGQCELSEKDGARYILVTTADSKEKKEYKVP